MSFCNSPPQESSNHHNHPRGLGLGLPASRSKDLPKDETVGEVLTDPMGFFLVVRMDPNTWNLKKGTIFKYIYVYMHALFKRCLWEN